MEGNRVREIREQKGLSLNKLAKITGISKSYLSFIERGKQTNPSVTIVKKIANALEIPMNELLYELKVRNKDSIDEKIHNVIHELSKIEISEKEFTQFKNMLYSIKEEVENSV
ncbi:transcriptional regulator with XRE-family HTH domain [Bacillus mesophilus]|uniref:Helix-turn-helix transcriptional regulator n=1 Tax=Bacillus mesophilus TaxID=1808955 RepID=A0A6M0Q7J3_9BACI|nr:helix-turn-helix transcriptional regulator [Bacillus mesophilus]MBM7661643.1 transcriptional regulator with XRE-family HTH domain [Bacillus mesophilus]NEY72311.1 helix-turn-helix transcriptional regulator [Bacillus mesophilus]